MRNFGLATNLVAVLSLFGLTGLGTVLAQEIPHEEVNFECETCHTTETFAEVEFDHSELTQFPLEGRHTGVNCTSCHDLKDFAVAKNDCASCHTDIHEAKLGDDCIRCHSPQSWNRFDIFDIHEETNFPIMGRHSMLDCESCHFGFPIGDLSHTDSRCIACHETDYLEVSNPDHVFGGFSTDCESCHQMNKFRPALFPDHNVYFPIFSGEHKGEWNSCNSCHTTPGSFTQFPCLECHEHRQPAMDGVHAGMAGYAYNSPDCYICHPRGKAEDFTAHDQQFFPIFSGRHSGTWDNCSICHETPLDRRVFSCLNCHDHRQSEMDLVHAGMTGYVYTSNDCLTCHPTGEAGDFTAHDQQFFPIFSGKHNGEWDACSNCHEVALDRGIFSCLNCHEQPATDQVHLGFSGYAYNSVDCYACHPTGEAGDFTDHDQQFFPIFSGKHNGEWDACSTCHEVPLDRKIFTCFNCHDHSQTRMDDKHLGEVQDYVYDSQACYDCHSNGSTEN